MNGLVSTIGIWNSNKNKWKTGSKLIICLMEKSVKNKKWILFNQIKIIMNKMNLANVPVEPTSLMDMS